MQKEQFKNISGTRPPHYLLGIDGGGTKTVFCLADESGKPLSTVYKGASNPNDIGMENTFSLLREGIFASTVRGWGYPRFFCGRSQQGKRNALSHDKRTSCLR